MSWATGLMVYFVIWWTVLFAVLPLGVRRAENPGRGEERGAPERPDLKRKAIITSLVAAVLWLVFYFLNQADVFSFRRMEQSSMNVAPWADGRAWSRTCMAPAHSAIVVARRGRGWDQPAREIRVSSSRLS